MTDATPLPRRVICCDFDGTITPVDTFIAMAEAFAPQVWNALRQDLFEQRISLRAFVEQLIGSIPSDCYPAMVEFVAAHPVRPGFPEFLDFLEAQAVPIVVVSGGLRGLVESVLHPWRDRLAGLHAAEVDLSGPTIRVHSAVGSERAFVDKQLAMSRYAADELIVIGDSITDVEIALAADRVFAHSPLDRYLEQAGRHDFHRWQDFHDLTAQLTGLWSGDTALASAV